MNEIVFIGNGQALTSSRLIAHKFDRNHRDVLKSIQNLDCSKEFTERNFALGEYKDATGRNLPEYILTKDGFTFLVMGFTGARAAKFKEEYIEAFNDMETQLKPKSNLDLMEMTLKELRANEQRISNAESRVQVLEAKSITSPEYFSVAGYASLIKRKITIDQAKQFGKEASKICREQNIPTDEIPDPRFGRVRCYPKEVLKSLFS